jgi:hypothetical protein
MGNQSQRADAKSDKPLQTVRYDISPETVTVLGRNVKETDAMWRGLDLDNADLLAQSTLMMMVCGSREAPFDLHLRTPWWHPDDGPAPTPPEMFYRVRPKMKVGKKWKNNIVRSVTFERVSGKWRLAVSFSPVADDLRRSIAAHNGEFGVRHERSAGN